jgi:transcriptional regulator with XRE-family HTH domain
MTKVGEDVRKARLAKGWTQHRLAAAVGMRETNLCKLENGHHEPATPTLQRLAKALGGHFVTDSDGVWFVAGKAKRRGE